MMRDHIWHLNISGENQLSVVKKILLMGKCQIARRTRDSQLEKHSNVRHIVNLPSPLEMLSGWDASRFELSNGSCEMN